MPTPDPNRTSTTDPDPSKQGGIGGLLGVIVLMLFAKFGLPIDQETQTWVMVGIGALGPVGAVLWVRLKAWHPASVARAQAMWMLLANEVQGQNPPAVVTNEPLSPVEAAATHPGTLGFAGIEDHEPEHDQAATTSEVDSFLRSAPHPHRGRHDRR